MKRQLLVWGTLLCQAIGMLAQVSFQKNEQIPDYPVLNGVSAPFAGFVGDWLVVGGGCNFPDVPAAEGGKKVYYNQCYALNTKADSLEWKPIVDLPLPVAYGCAVETPQGLVCLGGNNSDSNFTRAFRIQKGSGTSDFVIQSLPSLPEAIDNASATLLDGCVYITGGNQQQRQNSLYRLDLKKRVAWEKMASFPGPARVQPVLVNDGNSLYLIGGFQTPEGKKESILSQDVLQYIPQSDTWNYLSILPREATGEKRCLVGGSGTQNSKYLILTGGVNYTLFKRAIEGKVGKDYLTHEPAWYQFNDDVLCFDFKRQVWTVYPDVPGMARAGGVLLYHHSYLYMVCGEVKPGIRTSKIMVYPFKKEK